MTRAQPDHRPGEDSGIVMQILHRNGADGPLTERIRPATAVIDR